MATLIESPINEDTVDRQPLNDHAYHQWVYSPWGDQMSPKTEPMANHQKIHHQRVVRWPNCPKCDHHACTLLKKKVISSLTKDGLSLISTLSTA